jgi:hypothetical protein
MSLITPSMAASVGATLRTMASLPIDAASVRLWITGLYYPHPPPESLWRVEDGQEVLRVPKDFNPFVTLIADPPGYPAEMGSFTEWTEAGLGVEGPRTVGPGLNAGMTVRYVGPDLGVGDVVIAVLRLAGYEEVGSARPLLLTILEEEWSNPAGQLLQIRQRTIARRGAPSAS